ncbi:hypothetical protein CTI12_AA437160 [Artemisia annua]|uniref:Uncharacterized protein n=1 Tax=Artemisia annua TaxID=35608 RepID=A0A2U1LZ36_ARTAN|nr:hypothetical protein CTI12_AA437160 [Artemisia annua]
MGQQVPFRKVKVIETPEHGIFFTDVFDQQAFQRVSELHKVDTQTLLLQNHCTE